jgi:alginate O-acetyltransferase complex protein AlgJ
LADDAKTTEASGGARRGGALAGACLAATLLAAPIVEISWSLAHDRRPVILDAFSDLATRDEEKRVAFEEELHDASPLTQLVIPRYQQAATALLGAGNRKVVGARDGWLFLRDDVEIGCGVPLFGRGRAGDAAVAAIVDFRNELAKRDVELLLLPIPGKEAADPERLGSLPEATLAAARRGNPAFSELWKRLDEAGVRYLRVDETIAQLRAAHPGEPLYLSRDTHWTPATMRAVAGRVAAAATEILGEKPQRNGRFVRVPTTFRGQGDLVHMLGLAQPERLYPPMELSIDRVVDGSGGAAVAPSRDADVLLLGDSFTMVFGDASLGLGEGGGLAEQIAFELGRPLDVIALPGGGATATRAALARSSSRLDTKQLVIWQWSLRTLGGTPEEWRPTPIRDEAAEQEAGAHATIVGEIVEVTRIPARFDYAFCLATYEYRVLETIDGSVDGDRVWVAFPAIVDRKSTEARSFEVGERHRLVLEPLRNRYDLDRTGWMDDTGAEGRLWVPVKWERVERKEGS